MFVDNVNGLNDCIFIELNFKRIFARPPERFSRGENVIVYTRIRADVDGNETLNRR